MVWQLSIQDVFVGESNLPMQNAISTAIFALAEYF
jgi:hypothetical protein